MEYSWPEELLQDDPPASVLRVYRFLDQSCRHEFGRKTPCTWRYPSSIAAEMTAQGYPIETRTVQTALKWLEKNDWITRAPGSYFGREVSVIWCRWLILDEHEDFAGASFGGGFSHGGTHKPTGLSKSARRRLGDPNTSFSGADRAEIGAIRAEANAPISAPDSSNEFRDKENVNVSEASPVQRPPDPEPTEVARPPATIATKPDPRPIRGDDSTSPAPPRPPAAGYTPMELAGKLIRRFRDRGLDLVVIEDPTKGELIRPTPRTSRVDPITSDEIAELLALKPQVLAHLTSRASQATTPSGSPTATIDLIRRLASPAGPEVVKARIDELADRLASESEFDDPGWRNGFRRRVLDTIEQPQINPVKALISAYKTARSSTSKTKGRIFMDAHNKLTKRQPFQEKEQPNAAGS